MTPSVLRLIADRRPTSGVPGQLKTKDGHTLAVSIASRGDAVLLVLLVNPGALLDRGDGELLLESVTSRGVVRMQGTAERLEPDLYRFQAAGEPVVIQRREYVRVPALQQVALNDLCGFVVDTHAVNISGGGMLVAAKGDLTPGTELAFSLTLSSKQPPVTGIGEIVRTSEARQLAVAFREISDLDRDRLIRFLFDRQRRALALTRGDGI